MNIDDSGWKWMKVDEHGRKWMKVDEMDESGWKWMKFDETGEISWYVKCHEMSNVMKCQMSNVMKYQMSNIKCQKSKVMSYQFVQISLVHRLYTDFQYLFVLNHLQAWCIKCQFLNSKHSSWCFDVFSTILSEKSKVPFNIPWALLITSRQNLKPF